MRVYCSTQDKAHMIQYVREKISGYDFLLQELKKSKPDFGLVQDVFYIELETNTEKIIKMLNFFEEK